jgi:hypothetical protein
MDEDHRGESLAQEPQRRIDELERQLAEMRVWCRGLEQQQAQLAAVLYLTTGRVARSGLTRFPLGAALPEELPIHGQ